MNDFEARVAREHPGGLRAAGVEVLQLNLGLRCNLRCAHCHQDASAARTEAMSDAVFAAALRLARSLRPRLVDLTGGAPELHPRLGAWLEALRGEGLPVQIRTNLTALLEPGCEGTPADWARLGVSLLASLPASDEGVVERQRGRGTFARSLEVLRRLNAVGFGAGGALRLDLAHNPPGASLPAPAGRLEQDLRRALLERHGVRFDGLVVITNVPLGRFPAALADERRTYLEALRAAFNPATLPRLACRTTLAVGWGGTLHDCDFNLAAGIPICVEPRRVFDADGTLATRPLAFGLHCFACTAHRGSG